jgi:flagellar M-ring protein FliF
VQQLIDNLLSLGQRRLMILGGVAFGIIGSLVLGLAVISSPDRAPLYMNLSANSASAIQMALANAGFDAQMSADRTEVSVPRTDLARARMVVAEIGMPVEGEPGWELFDDRNAMAMNSFMQRVNRLRAMEGELGRSIQTLDGVQSARVHLVLPEREPFARTKPEPRASVIVRAAIGSAIERNQAVAIRALIASSVPELSPEHVTVLSAKGETILGDSGGGTDTERPLQAARTAIEDRLARQVEEILSARVGAGNARVRVNVDLTTAREVVIEEIFDPEQQIVRSTESRSERRDETDTGGNVGVENNIPAALQDGAADNARSSQENSGETVEYEIGSTRREIVREAGEIERISVAVLVNGIYSVEDGGVSFSDRTPEELAQLTELVRTAVGFNQGRGDTVSVASLRFMDYSMEMGEPIALSLGDRITQNIVPILRGLLGLIVVALILILGVRPLLRQLKEEPEELAPAALDPPPMELTEASPEPEPQQVPALPDPPQARQRPVSRDMPGVTSVFDPDADLGPHEYIETMGIRGRLTKARVDAIRDAADDRPDEVLRVLRSWLAQEAEA